MSIYDADLTLKAYLDLEPLAGSDWNLVCKAVTKLQLAAREAHCPSAEGACAHLRQCNENERGSSPGEAGRFHEVRKKLIRQYFNGMGDSATVSRPGWLR